MKIKITKYDVERNQFECSVYGHPEWDRFDPFVSAITNGDEYLEFNQNMVGKTIDVDVYNHGRALLLSSKGEEEYKKLITLIRTKQKKGIDRE